jgi:2-keto-4-pentenoate hydratase/2-oxohepta-3-ene-1,7-dioic acid hydratase in catechol pathway
MRFVQFSTASGICPGVLVGTDHLVNLKTASAADTKRFRSPLSSVLDLLQQGEEALNGVRALVDELVRAREGDRRGIPDGVLLKRDTVTLVAPLLHPQKIIGVGLNYGDHCRENHLEPPKKPITFAKYPSAIIGPEEAIDLHPECTQQVDYEAELGVVIGKVTRQVSREEAMASVAGYTIINDVSARDIQFSEGQWVRAKSLDTFCPLGPVLVSRDEIPNPHSLEISCTLGGETVQHSNTRHLLFDVPYLVSFLSQGSTLLPGDVISTGTPGGVGYYRKPQRFLMEGDTVQIEIEQIGVLRNPVVRAVEQPAAG